MKETGIIKIIYQKYRTVKNKQDFLHNPVTHVEMYPMTPNLIKSNISFIRHRIWRFSRYNFFFHALYTHPMSLRNQDESNKSFTKIHQAV